MHEAALCLSISIVMEASGAVLLRFARETSIAWYIVAYGMYAVSLGLFPYTLVVIPLYIAYAVWAACGCVLTTVAGVILFGEEPTRLHIASLLAIVAGVIGLGC